MKEEDKKKLILDRATFRVITKKELENALNSNKKLRIKYGIDPTAPKIHLGRASTIQKLRDFQDLGHKIVLIIGDFTGLVGDASDKQEARAKIESSELENNLKTYKTQLEKILDLSKIEYRYNSEWLSKLKFNDIINIAEKFTVAQLIERENFSDRYKNHKPIGLHEFLYPLMQGYDSVAIKSDVELGGSDQLFNILAGREIQGYFNMHKQICLTKKLLSGTDGRKMSSSWGNVINITDEPNNIYGKVMSIRDSVIIEYFDIATRISTEDIKTIEKDLDNSTSSGIMNIKKILAYEITKLYSSKTEAIKAEENFKKTVQEKQIVSEDLLVVSTKIKKSGIIDLITSLTNQVPSKAHARRMVKEGGVYIDNTRINDINLEIDIKSDMIVKVGKRNAVKIKTTF